MRKRNRQWNLLITAVLMLIVALPLVIFVGGALFLYWQAVSYLPTPAQTTYLDPIIGPTELYDSSGQTLLFSVEDPLGNERQWLSLNDLPPYVIEATLMMEDADFLDTTRFSTLWTLNRLWSYMFSSGNITDLSLTGRLVENAILPLASHSGLDASLLKIVLSAEINRMYTPEQVLEWHLNTNYYSNDAYGIDAAARVYLGKSARDLSIDEAALLAPIPVRTQYNPFDNEVAARGRQRELLNQLRDQNVISQQEYELSAAIATPLQRNSLQVPTIAPAFSIYARNQAEDILDLLGLDGARKVSRDGLKITTSIDLDLYYQSECTLRIHIGRLNGLARDGQTLTGQPCAGVRYLPPPALLTGGTMPDTGSLVLIDVETGEIKSMVGTVDEHIYQPGPALYPFVYFEGFISTIYTPATMVLDIPRFFPGPADGLIYTPVNPDGVFRGPINLRDAMASGLRVPAVAVADSQGIAKILRSSHLIGLNSLNENQFDVSLLEYGGAVSTLDMTYAYSVFSSMGVMHGVDRQPIASGYRSRDPVAVLKIEDAGGNILWEYDETRKALSRTNVFVDSVGYMINEVLSDDVTRRAVLGINDEVLNLGRPAALVNGMTSDNVDGWTLGYTPQLTAGVHISRSDRLQMDLEDYDLQGSAPIWRSIMAYAHERDNLTVRDWSRPESIGEFTVCDRSGMVPGAEGCDTRREIMPVTAKVPVDTYWKAVDINNQTNQLANSNTPTNLRSRVLFFIPPAEAMEWWESNNQPLPPTEYALIRPEVIQAVEILQPRYFDYVSGVVDVRGSIDLQDIQYYQLRYGQGVDPQQWFEIGERQTVFEPGQSLGLWDTGGLDGVYTLQLVVVLADNSIDSTAVQISVDNQPPVISSFEAGLTGQTFVWPVDTRIPLSVNVTDNLTIEKVEFYHNGLLLGEDREWPYGFEFSVIRPGVEVFTAVVYDRVGNNSSVELSVEIERTQ